MLVAYTMIRILYRMVCPKVVLYDCVVDSSLDFVLFISMYIVQYVVIMKTVSKKLADIYDEARWKVIYYEPNGSTLYETSDDAISGSYTKCFIIDFIGLV